jgi:hypothetical protein
MSDPGYLFFFNKADERASQGRKGGAMCILKPKFSVRNVRHPRLERVSSIACPRDKDSSAARAQRWIPTQGGDDDVAQMTEYLPVPHGIAPLTRILACCAFLALLCATHSVHGEEAATNADLIALNASTPLSDSDMDGKRGAGNFDISTSTSTQTLTATSTGNSVTVNGNMTNGSITTGSNFGGSGFGSYVMNTGNNATINSGLSLSVLLK